MHIKSIVNLYANYYQNHNKQIFLLKNICPLVLEQIGATTKEKASRTIAVFQGIKDGIYTDFILKVQFQIPNTSTASFKLTFWITKEC